MTTLKNKCADIDHLIDRFVAGTLSESEFFRTQQHLSSCPNCTVRVHQVQQALDRLTNQCDLAAEARTISEKRRFELAGRIAEKIQADQVRVERSIHQSKKYSTTHQETADLHPLSKEPLLNYALGLVSAAVWTFVCLLEFMLPADTNNWFSMWWIISGFAAAGIVTLTFKGAPKHG